jgi:hypothetical protein
VGGKTYMCPWLPAHLVVHGSATTPAGFLSGKPTADPLPLCPARAMQKGGFTIFLAPSTNPIT